MRINIPQIVEKSSKRRAQFLTKSAGIEILNNYCGLRQPKVVAGLTLMSRASDCSAFNPVN
jgi:hypothetical protein